jgi:hypothetical protein
MTVFSSLIAFPSFILNLATMKGAPDVRSITTHPYNQGVASTVRFASMCESGTVKKKQGDVSRSHIGSSRRVHHGAAILNKIGREFASLILL